MNFVLTEPFSVPLYQNAAGRLLVLLKVIADHGNQPYFDVGKTLYMQGMSESGENNDENILQIDDKERLSSRTFFEFQKTFNKCLSEFYLEIQRSEMPNDTKLILRNGLRSIDKLASPLHPANAPYQVTEAENSLLMMAASMLKVESKIEQTEIDEIRDLINELRRKIVDSDIKKSVRDALLQVVKLAREAVDEYEIMGVKGFKDSFNMMLARLLEARRDGGEEVEQKSYWGSALHLLNRFDLTISKTSEYSGHIETFKPVLNLLGINIDNET